jgi:diguanylate cyclase (GGDEF)-like protein
VALVTQPLPGPATERSTLRVLTIEDNPGDARLVRAMLAEAAPADVVVEVTPRLATGVQKLLNGDFECVLLDLSLPDAEGLDGLTQLRAVADDVPVVVLSGRADEALAMRAVQEGAQDYLVKGEVDGRLLYRSIAYAIERKRAEVQLAHQALHDQLTHLPNRALFLDRLGQALTRLGRHHTALAVIFCDLDRFKVVNDALGHDAGDLLLVDVAARLTGALRAGDTAARFGGDEFVVLCEDITGEQQAIEVAERLAGALRAPCMLGREEVFVHTSMGIALASDAGARAEALIRDADAAMYRAKDRGGGLYEVFDDELRARAVHRQQVEHALHRAIDRGELEVHYQPQVRMATGALYGVEALVRWRHPERGLIGPDHFIPAAEETGIIHALGLHVLDVACRQAAEWQARGTPLGVQMSVNLSPRQCLHPDLVEMVARVLADTGADPALLCLEVTETAVMEDLTAMGGVLKRLRNLGLTLAIDDFGTGYSSLRALQRLPFDIVKIDRSFVSGLHTSDQEAAIVAAVISLSHALGKRTVAEGVEEVQQVERLRGLGCDVGQGYHYARPQPVDELGYGL